MNVPGWWGFVLLALSAFRCWRLLAEDAILDRPRDALTRKLGSKWDEFVVCPWCAGFWIAVAWWVAWEVWPHGTLGVAVPFALSAVVGLIALLAESD